MLKLTGETKKFEHCKDYEHQTENWNHDASRIGNKSFLSWT